MAEETRAMTKEMRAAVAGGVVTIALVALFAVGHKAGLTETTAYALAIATGLVIYGVVSGRLTEFSGGGLSAKLTSIVHSEINITSVSLKALSDDMGVIKSIPKGNITGLRVALQHLTETTPIVLSLTLGSPNNLEFVRAYLAALSVYRSFRFVLLLNSDGILQASVPAAILTRLLRKVDGDPITEDKKANELIEAINEGVLDKLRAEPGVTTAMLRPDATNLAALETMTKENLDAIVVVDKNGRPISIIDRSQLVAKFILVIAQSSTSP